MRSASFQRCIGTQLGLVFKTIKYKYITDSSKRFETVFVSDERTDFIFATRYSARAGSIPAHPPTSRACSVCHQEDEDVRRKSRSSANTRRTATATRAPTAPPVRSRQHAPRHPAAAHSPAPRSRPTTPPVRRPRPLLRCAVVTTSGHQAGPCRPRRPATVDSDRPGPPTSKWQADVLFGAGPGVCKKPLGGCW